MMPMFLNIPLTEILMKFFLTPNQYIRMVRKFTATIGIPIVIKTQQRMIKMNQIIVPQITTVVPIRLLRIGLLLKMTMTTHIMQKTILTKKIFITTIMTISLIITMQKIIITNTMIRSINYAPR